ncbi:hypothetical protein TTHERM_001014505 (macronuclear) [Tetrahymena thermophila SB210]|uniref:Uncharacterized protein n=1 Tax=Tetrahymena thermophila (strain SB210) TaxID=312017 RepID=W7X014_TETTS|nr:hypothetical protein TTHERM_001014505 [Tetrahymena thermophila SB210]EWS72445.1 hypothetical protein TTHERM_001014505 [Tetrahymena thermophila SB210]|eukprot:XP_012655016.1 hypothetical protein TTHERM_001014505 [Tetrahymena thermophila SB210]
MNQFFLKQFYFFVKGLEVIFHILSKMIKNLNKHKQIYNVFCLLITWNFRELVWSILFKKVMLQRDCYLLIQFLHINNIFKIFQVILEHICVQLYIKRESTIIVVFYDVRRNAN